MSMEHWHNDDWYGKS